MSDMIFPRTEIPEIAFKFMAITRALRRRFSIFFQRSHPISRLLSGGRVQNQTQPGFCYLGLPNSRFSPLPRRSSTYAGMGLHRKLTLRLRAVCAARFALRVTGSGE